MVTQGANQDLSGECLTDTFFLEFFFGENGKICRYLWKKEEDFFSNNRSSL